MSVCVSVWHKVFNYQSFNQLSIFYQSVIQLFIIILSEPYILVLVSKTDLFDSTVYISSLGLVKNNREVHNLCSVLSQIKGGQSNIHLSACDHSYLQTKIALDSDLPVKESTQQKTQKVNLQLHLHFHLAVLYQKHYRRNKPKRRNIMLSCIHFVL